MDPVRPVTAWDEDFNFLGDELVVAEPLCCLVFDEREEWLTVNLVRTKKVYDNGCICDIKEPVRVVEAEIGEEVSRGGVPERCVAKAAAKHVEEGCD